MKQTFKSSLHSLAVVEASVLEVSRHSSRPEYIASAGREADGQLNRPSPALNNLYPAIRQSARLQTLHGTVSGRPHCSGTRRAPGTLALIDVSHPAAAQALSGGVLNGAFYPLGKSLYAPMPFLGF
jgi:hypothetical protein